ncbi:DUF6364 family protein [Bacteroidales bacterium OttesenSCG-928-I21]|nr:DUF6364 family protein [Bacteroidales bacterium OttesenSCG-928-I21]
MNTKLTLNLDKEVIEEAKTYARKNKVSLSKLIENYLNSLTKPSKKSQKVSPLVESLTGVISDKNLDERKDYRDYLNEKYS